MLNWRKHEERCKNSKYYRNYNMQWQKHSRSTGRRPDGYGVNKNNPRDRIVSEAKWCKEAKKKHVDQIQKYKQYPFFAKKGVIHYPQNVKIPKNVKKYANDKNVIFTKTRVPKVKEPIGMMKYLIEPRYKP